MTAQVREACQHFHVVPRAINRHLFPHIGVRLREFDPEDIRDFGRVYIQELQRGFFEFPRDVEKMIQHSMKALMPSHKGKYFSEMVMGHRGDDNSFSAIWALRPAHALEPLASSLGLCFYGTPDVVTAVSQNLTSLVNDDLAMDQYHRPQITSLTPAVCLGVHRITIDHVHSQTTRNAGQGPNPVDIFTSLLGRQVINAAQSVQAANAS